MPDALKQFREREDITEDSVLQDEYKFDIFYGLFRAKDVRVHFRKPDELSSTDTTDEEKRVIAAARAIEDKGVREGYEGLSKVLQELVVGFSNRVNADATAEARATLNNLWGIAASEESDERTIHPASASSLDTKSPPKSASSLAAKSPPQKKQAFEHPRRSMEL